MPDVCCSDEPNAVEEDVAAEAVDIQIPGYSSLEHIYGTSDERLYTLNGTEDATGIRKRLRFAPGQFGRARLRLGHELSVLEALSSNRLRHIPHLEDVVRLRDRSICAVFPFKPVQTFQEFSDFVRTLEWGQRLGEILKFAQSLAALLSEIHLARVFRTSKFWMDFFNIQTVIYLPNGWKFVRMVRSLSMTGAKLYSSASRIHYLTGSRLLKELKGSTRAGSPI